MRRMDEFEEDNEALSNKLLCLIEEGDATAILSTQYTKSLNELIKFEFISIENDVLRLTEKGIQAKARGVKAMMEQQISLEEKVEFNNISEQKIPPGISNRSFLIILFFFLVSLLAMITVSNL